VKKRFVSFDEVRNNGIKLAYKIYKDTGIPDIIYVLLRGGALLGNILSEYFKILCKNKRPVYYAAVVARAFNDIHRADRVMVDGWTYNPDYLRQGDKILLVDDIFDTGRTINYLAEIIIDKGIPRHDIKIAVHDYKVRKYTHTQLPIQPDYYCYKHIIEQEKNDFWIHYLSHELASLTKEELEKYYYVQDPSLKEALNTL